MSQRNFLLLLLTTVVSYVCYLQGAQDPYGRYVASGLRAIEDNSLDPVPSRELFDDAMEGMVKALQDHGDQHSQFLSEAKAGQLRNEIHQQVGGIGEHAALIGEPPQLMIVGPPDPGTPAAKANLTPGVRISQIDGTTTDGIALDDALAMLRGAPGSTLRLQVERSPEAKPEEIELVRAVIPVESILGDRRASDGQWVFTLEDDPRVAYIRIVAFGERTAYEFSNVMKRLESEGVKAIVLDVRDNAGGSLSAAVAICEMLLPAGKTIVETRGRDHELRQRYASTSDGLYRDLPVAVIVNQRSASAAEIVAACLQDYGRAAVVGERSFGKGTVQQLVPLESGRSLLKLTWASFWRPNGTNVHRARGATESDAWGVQPDEGYECTLSPKEYEAYQKYRERRDRYRYPINADNSGSSAGSAGGESDDFIDGPLKMAEIHLAGILDARP
jgi:carboxyl-terminal processing protease